MVGKLILEDYPGYINYLKDAEGVRPRSLNLELTSFCNLKCIMCPKTVGFHMHKPNNEITGIVIEKIIRQILPSVHHINIMGFGEPLLALDKLFKLLEVCKQLYITVNMITNGLLLDSKISRRFVELGLYNINISLDAASASTYKKIRNADFDKVFQNIVMLKEIKNDLGKALPTLQLSFVGMVDNISELPDFIRLAANVGANRVVLQAMSEVPKSLVHEKDVFIHNRELGLSNYKKAQEIARESGIILELFPPDQFDVQRDDNLDFHRIPELNGMPLRKDCIEPWNAVFIASDGGVSPCCGLPSFEYLNLKDFDDIWYGKKMQNLRRTLKTDKIQQNCIYCRGAGWQQPTEVKQELLVGRDDRQLGVDWYSTEQENGRLLRWSGRTGTYFVKQPERTAYIEVESLTPDAKLTVYVDDKKLFSEKMRGNGLPDRFYLDIIDNPSVTEEKILKIKLETNKTRKPAEIYGADGRQVGFKFYFHSILKSLNFEQGWQLLYNVNRSNSFLKTKVFTFSIDTLTFDGKGPSPTLLIHFVKTGNVFKRAIDYFLPDGLLRIMGMLFAGDFPLKIAGEAANGTRLEQNIVRREKAAKKGKYRIYIGLYNRRTGKRLNVIKQEKTIISKNRALIDIIEIK